MTSKGCIFRSWPFWVALGLLLVSQTFYLGLSFSGLNKLHLESRLAVEKILLEDLSRRFGYTVRTGRDLHRYPRLEKEMARVTSLSQADYFLVTDIHGWVLGGRAPETFFPPRNKTAASTDAAFEFKDGGRTWLGRLIIDRQDAPAGYIYLTAGGQGQSQNAWRLFQERSRALLSIAGLSAGLLALALVWGHRRIADGTMSRLKIYALFLVPFLLGQFFFYTLSLSDITGLYQRQNQDVGGQLARILSLDLERILDRNVNLDDIPGLDRHLEGLLRGVPLAASIKVMDRKGSLVAGVGGEARPFLSIIPVPEVTEPLFAHDLPAGQVEIRLSERVVRNGWIRLVLDSVTMTLVAGLLLLELARLVVLKLRRPVPVAGRAPAALGEAALMRPLIFVAIFALDMSISFIPLKMAALRFELGSLPPALILSLPVSTEMALAGLVMVTGAFWAGRLGGWRPLFLGGTLLAAMGYILSGLAGTALAYILGRGLAGLGYGALNFASQIYVVDRTGAGNQGEAMGDLFAGFFSGGLCGCAAGGLLADRLGFDSVFFMSAVIFISLSLVTFLFPRDSPAVFGATDGTGRTPVFGGLSHFLRSRPVWSLGLLCVLPAALAMVGLVNYFLPIHLAGLGAGQVLISQLNVLFSLLVVVLGPILGRRLDGSRRPYLYLVLAGLLAALAFPSFILWPTVAGAVAAMIFLGISNAISENGQPAYLLGRPETRQVGSNQALSVFNAFARLGQVVGPLALAGALSWDGPGGLIWLGGILAGLTLLFWILAPKTERE